MKMPLLSNKLIVVCTKVLIIMLVAVGCSTNSNQANGLKRVE